MNEHSHPTHANFAELESAGVLAVLKIDDVADAVPLAKALLSGGIRAMELTLRTEVALDALRAIRKDAPEMLVGVGTVLSPEQVQQVVAEGAAFGVSPGTNPQVVEAALKCGLPFAPGIATPTDIEVAVALGCRLLKFFPAGSCGGLTHLRNMAVPFQHLGVKYIPLGGVNQSNLAEFLSEPLVAAVGGSWLAPPQTIAEKDWNRIEQIAREASGTVAAIRR